MDGERKSCTERILSAIEYGKLSNDETERRLCELVEAEVNKTDSEADMELVKACQSLMWQLHTHGELPYDSHYDENKAKIDQRLKRNTLVSNTVQSVGKMLAVAAAVVLVVLGLRGDLHWIWLEQDDTVDQQQHIISGNEIAIELIQEAIAENIDQGYIRTSKVSELSDHFRYIPIPNIVNEVWCFAGAEASFTPGFIKVNMQYKNADNDSGMLYTVMLFTDAEEAYFTFEQSAKGDEVVIGNHRVYVTSNTDKPVLCWTKGLVFVRITGDFQENEGLILIEHLLEEWYK